MTRTDGDARRDDESALHVDACESTRSPIVAGLAADERRRRHKRGVERRFAELACRIAQMRRQFTIARNALAAGTLDLVRNQNRAARYAASQTAAESDADDRIVEVPAATDSRFYDANVETAELALRGAILGLRRADDDHFR